MICTLPSIRRCTPARYRLQWGPGVRTVRLMVRGWLDQSLGRQGCRLASGLAAVVFLQVWGPAVLGAGVELSRHVKLWCGSRYRVACVVVEKFLCIVTARDRAVRCGMGWLALGEKRLQVDSDGGSGQQNCHDCRWVFLVPLGERCREVRSRGERTMGIDRSVPVRSEVECVSRCAWASCGCRTKCVRSSQTARSPWPSPPGM